MAPVNLHHKIFARGWRAFNLVLAECSERGTRNRGREREERRKERKRQGKGEEEKRNIENTGRAREQ